jgi:hypothetical protein
VFKRIRLGESQVKACAVYLMTSTHTSAIPRGQLASSYNLSDFLAPVLQRLLHEGHELVGDGAVDQAMVVAKS